MSITPFCKVKKNCSEGFRATLRFDLRIAKDTIQTKEAHDENLTSGEQTKEEQMSLQKDSTLKLIFCICHVSKSLPVMP